MFTSIKAYLYGGMAVIILGLGATIWIQSGRIDRLKVEVAQLQTDKTVCLSANVDNDRTIKELKSERVKANKLCEIRLADAYIKADTLRKIDETKGGQHNEQTGDGNMDSTGGGNSGGRDALLDLLNNGMLSGQGGGEDGVHKASGAERAGRAELLPGQLGYCLDEVNSKNLLKNMVLVRSWALDMQTILTSLQTGTGQ